MPSMDDKNFRDNKKVKIPVLKLNILDIIVNILE